MLAPRCTPCSSVHGRSDGIACALQVGLLGSSVIKSADRATRVLSTCSSFTSAAAVNQLAVAKVGGIPPLITWLGTMAAAPQAMSAQAVLSLVTNNSQTQSLVAKANAILPLVALVKRSSPSAQEFAARALWHLASQAENRQLIVEGNAIKPLVGMISAEGELAPEISAVVMVRLARNNPDVSVTIADMGGIVPLVKLRVYHTARPQLPVHPVHPVHH